MKKILVLFVVMLLSVTTCFAKNKKEPVIKFGGDKYKLQYSTKSKDTNGYLNEYFKLAENYNTWSEMIGIHHFPNAFSPVDQVVDFRKYLNSTNCPSALYFDEKNNVAMIDFVVINDNKLPIIIEFNVFKYVKNEKCGSTGIQYAKRYVVTTAYQSDAAKKEIEKIRKKTIKRVKHLKAPYVVEQDIDRGPNQFKPTVEKKQEKKTVEAEPVKDEAVETTDVVTEPNEVKVNDKKAVKKEDSAEKTEDSAEKTEDSAEKTEEGKMTEEKPKQEVKKEEVKKEEPKVLKEEKTKKEAAEENKKQKQEKTEKIKEEKQKKADKVSNKQEKVKPEKVRKEKVKKEKVKKEKPYKVENSKEDYTKSRDYKKIRNDKKHQIKEAKKQKKLNAKKAKEAQKRAKKAEKALKEK